MRPRAPLPLVLALAALCAAAPVAQARSGNPDYRSRVTGFSQEYGGLFAHVVGYDDRIAVLNRSSNPFVVYGYRGEPSVRFRADRVVQVNRASPRTRPRWETVSRNGRYSWRDRRIRWTGSGIPPQVHDPEQRTKVVDWKIPYAFDGSRGTLDGTLTWIGRPSSGGSSRALAIAIAIAIGLALTAATALMVTRRRVVTA